MLYSCEAVPKESPQKSAVSGGLLEQRLTTKYEYMQPPKKSQTGYSRRCKEGDTVIVRPPRTGPPQLYRKVLVDGTPILIAACTQKGVDIALFLRLMLKMNKHNIVHLSLHDLAEQEQVSYRYASEKMGALCNAQLLCRTGKHSVWMVNPNVCVQCSEEQFHELVLEWNAFIAAIQERKRHPPTGTLGLEGEKESSTTKESNNVSA